MRQLKKRPHSTLCLDYYQEQCAESKNILLLLVVVVLKEVASARLRESDIHPISSNTPAPQYQPIDRKKRKGKIVENYSRDRAAYTNKKSIGPALEIRQSHTIEHGVSRIIPQGN